MNIDPTPKDIQANITRLGQALIVQSDTIFRDSLALGQILKGKVLLHYEGTRYRVAFCGEEKVVDSAVPLRKNELIYGKVVGLSDKVYLQRQPPPNGARAGIREEALAKSEASVAGSPAHLVDKVFARYQGILTLKERALLLRVMGQQANQATAVMSALVLKKMGLPLNRDVIRAVSQVLESERPTSLQHYIDVPGLSIERHPKGYAGEEIEALGSALQEMLTLRKVGDKEYGATTYSDPLQSQRIEISGKKGANAGSADQDSRESREFGTWLLNGQTDGSVAHRICSFPIWFDDRLMEVDAALFNQKKGIGNRDLRFRRIVLALDMERLGHVEVVVAVAGRNLRLDVRGQEDGATEAMAAHLQTLRETLTEQGWKVDSINYTTVLEGKRGEVVRSVLEHFITQDSVNHLV